MRYVMNDNQMGEWRRICKEFCKRNGLTLLFVNNESFGAEDSDGNMHHVYIDELMEILKEEG